MASDAVDTAFRARLAAITAADPASWSTVILYVPNGIMQVPTDGTPFISLQFPVAHADRVNVGPNPVRRETGAARFVLEIPAAAGVSPWGARVDALRLAFTEAQFDGVTTYTADPPVFDDSNPDGMYWALAFVVEFYADTFA